MKLLLDECLPVKLRGLLSGHEAFSAEYMGWKGVRNGRLLAKAANEKFDAFITSDGSIEYQQNLATLPLAVIVLHAKSNQMEDLAPLVPSLLEALAGTIRPGVYHVEL